MKKPLLLLLISFGLFGCSSLPVGDALTSMELDDALSSEDEAQRILSLGLTHEENLIEASKLGTPHLVSVVSLKLTNARDEKIQNDFDGSTLPNPNILLKITQMLKKIVQNSQLS